MEITQLRLEAFEIRLYKLSEKMIRIHQNKDSFGYISDDEIKAVKLIAREYKRLNRKKNALEKKMKKYSF